MFAKNLQDNPMHPIEVSRVIQKESRFEKKVVLTTI